MQPSTQATPSPNSESFAGLLASLASPAKGDSAGGLAWSDGDLEDDVVTLSYERAFREAVNRGEEAAPEAAGAQPVIAAEPIKASNFHLSAGPLRVTAHTAAEPERRTASVTVRLSAIECARLRQRATEAGLTASAYLRSCVLEADTLRAQVKQALAEMRTAGKTGDQGNEGPRDQGNSGTRKRGYRTTRLVRVLAHIGNLCIGLSADK